MSKVSRSTFQKLAEENKRLLHDIYNLTKDGEDYAKFETRGRWKKHFREEREFNELLKEVSKKYIDEHPEYHWIRDFKVEKK